MRRISRKKTFITASVSIAAAVILTIFSGHIALRHWNVGEACSLDARLYYAANHWELQISGAGEMKNLNSDGVKLAWHRDLYNLSAGWTIPIQEIHIEEGVTSVSERAFVDMKSLSVVYLAGSIRTIRENAFRNCSNVEQVYYNGTTQQWSEVSLEESWNRDSSISEIICLDGVVDLA
ncbi:MAG: leucine-rich repeat domain-containing protein [Clostridiales bacterium]|nr:leucine-rich repeat domain-containing protein [Clostridiales bacterium]